MENKCNSCFYALMDKDLEAPCTACVGYSNYVKGTVYMTSHASKPLKEAIDEWFKNTNGTDSEDFWVSYKGVTHDPVEKPKQPEYTGGSVSYYRVSIPYPTAEDIGPYVAECNDIIEALGMTFAEGNVFKAVWRRCAARNQNLAKKGYTDGLYDAEKIVFFGERMVQMDKLIDSYDESDV